MNVTGIAGGRSTHPCPFCEATINIHTKLAKQLSAGKLRSCASNRRHFKAYKRSKERIQKKHKNCIYDPIHHFPQSIPIINYIRIPQVHSFLHLNWYIKKIKTLDITIETWSEFVSACIRVCELLCAYVRIGFWRSFFGGGEILPRRVGCGGQTSLLDGHHRLLRVYTLALREFFNVPSSSAGSQKPCMWTGRVMLQMSHMPFVHLNFSNMCYSPQLSAT